MNSPRAPEPKAIVAAVLVSLACAWLAFGALSGLSRPGDLKTRTGEVEGAITRVEAAQREGGDPSAYVPDAICREAPARAAERLRARLGVLAAAAGLETPKVVIDDAGPADVSAALTPVMFRLQASGRYDLVLAYLKLLSRDGPEIFADVVDLRSQVSAVSLNLSGRVLCSNSLL